MCESEIHTFLSLRNSGIMERCTHESFHNGNGDEIRRDTPVVFANKTEKYVGIRWREDATNGAIRVQDAVTDEKSEVSSEKRVSNLRVVGRSDHQNIPSEKY
ncbi:hypothetical protein NY2A_b250R [Paramecium bursaria Chlorella virus NY2A]|uniref:Uncharacterized protein b250R n=1 Tax=Paramecium bursaria Chlorella virus NY2A TaxID=46021 RepID=A7IWC5_PBCVN|nr:hypothetical protein NY2A_b250R [Paramecium bursaria Chlorella virus NY2A]ABT14649.1 hypothetical protein NY2A_b250R [Paramecium bursaria Chlorella virus NY2A]